MSDVQHHCVRGRDRARTQHWHKYVIPIDGDLKGYLSGRSTRTFHTPPSYGAETKALRSEHQIQTHRNCVRQYSAFRRIKGIFFNEALTSRWTMELDHKLVESTKDGDLVFAFDADIVVKEERAHAKTSNTGGKELKSNLTHFIKNNNAVSTITNGQTV